MMTLSKGMLFGALVVVPVFASGCAEQRLSDLFEALPVQALPVPTGRLVTLSGSPSENERQMKDLQAWADAEGAEVRVVDSSLGVAEVFGASQDEVQAALPSARVTENKYLPNLIRSKWGTAEALDSVAPARLNCTSIDETLELNAGILRSSSGILDRGIVRIGAGAVNFGVMEKNAVPLTFAWIVEGPGDSVFVKYGSAGDRLSFAPDVPGGYSLTAIGARGDGRCQGMRLAFGATTSESFKGRQAPRAFTSEDRTRFGHLAVVHAEAAWLRTKGQGVKIAIVDTGANFNHPDLSQNMAIKADGQVVGYNFWANNSNPFDDEGHGTHVSGLAASAVMGLAPEATIIPIKALNAVGGGDLAAVVAAVRYAASQGAHIINASLGAEDEEFAVIDEAIREATAAGALFVVAAGNGDESARGFDIERRHVYPALLDQPGLLAVAATRSDGALSSYSNFSRNKVHVAAPGGDSAPGQGPLLSANYVPGKRLYQAQMGTSMATPVTAGIAALVKSLHMDYTPLQLKQHLIRSGSNLPALAGKVVSGRLLNAETAVTEL